MKNNIKFLEGEHSLIANHKKIALAMTALLQGSAIAESAIFIDFNAFMSAIQQNRQDLKDNVNTWFIGGASGLGKTFLAAQLAGRFHILTHNLDKFGHKETKEEKEQWIVDWAVIEKLRLKSGLTVFEGVGDNLSELNSKDISLLLIPMPDLATFKAINAAKAMEHEKKHGPNEWSDGWKTKSKYSQSQLNDYVVSKALLFNKHVNPAKVVFVMMNRAEKVSKGWH